VVGETVAMTQPVPRLDLAVMIGGRRGVLDTTAPGVALVTVDTFAPLGWAIAVSVGVALCLAVLRRLRGQPLRQTAMGVVGIAFAAGLAAVTGDPKKFFLPGILINAAYALVTLVSIAVRRPLIGYVIALLDRGYSHWKDDAGLRRAVTYATAMWTVVFAVRASVQGYLYAQGHVHLLAPVRLLLGLPLFFVAVAGTLFVLEGRRIDHDGQPVDDGSGWAPAS
jgi:Protein of unknown function (DUF3159)